MVWPLKQNAAMCAEMLSAVGCHRIVARSSPRTPPLSAMNKTALQLDEQTDPSPPIPRLGGQWWPSFSVRGKKFSGGVSTVDRLDRLLHHRWADSGFFKCQQSKAVFEACRVILLAVKTFEMSKRQVFQKEILRKPR